MPEACRLAELQLVQKLGEAGLRVGTFAAQTVAGRTVAHTRATIEAKKKSKSITAMNDVRSHCMDPNGNPGWIKSINWRKHTEPFSWGSGPADFTGTTSDTQTTQLQSSASDVMSDNYVNDTANNEATGEENWIEEENGIEELSYNADSSAMIFGIAASPTATSKSSNSSDLWEPKQMDSEDEDSDFSSGSSNQMTRSDNELTK